MTNSFIYRQGAAADKDVLMQLAQEAYGQYAETLGDENWQKMKSSLHDEARFTELLQKSVSFVCTHEGKIVGAAYLMPSGNPTDFFKTEWCYIRLLGVRPGYSNNGIAKELTKMCLAYARETNETTMALHTSEFMDAARHIYEKLGFAVLRELDAYYGKKYWIYTLDLATAAL
jgi:ribosomal protein S18 acetylase RimI-like enzyme